MDKLRIEVEVEGRDSPATLEVDASLKAVIAAVQKLAGTDDIHIFERDKDEPIGKEIEKKKVLLLVAHRCKKVRVNVRYEHDTKHEEFPPGVTVFRVLQWAVSKKGFGLDDIAKAKANLILPGAEEPIAKDTVIGRLVPAGVCELTVDLTLKDFTNG
jgi:hypothetical protein